jgi:hypothetical protein
MIVIEISEALVSDLRHEGGLKQYGLLVSAIGLWLQQLTIVLGHVLSDNSESKNFVSLFLDLDGPDETSKHPLVAWDVSHIILDSFAVE